MQNVPDGYLWSWGNGSHKFKQPQDLIIYGSKVGPGCQEQLIEGTKQQWRIEETEAEQCAKVERHFFFDPDDKEFKETFFFLKKKKTHGKSWSDGSGCAL